ncbi:MAG TPA: KaiC family protein [Methanoregulaceae archaeon]|nr:KaiC family protein [Methanoregulaceae archaeon]
MPKRKKQNSNKPKKLTGIEKCPTGIRGLDEVTFGGLPRGRPTLVAGGAGSGKTLLAMEFIVHGIMDYGESGVFMAFEETAQDLVKNVASLGFDLQEMVERKQLEVDYVRVERSEIEETGEYDLEGLFVRLNTAIDAVGAKRVVLDTVESLFAGLPNEAILRAELRRLFRWLKEKGVTTVITGEQGERTLTRHGLEEYVSDCVIFLDHRVVNQIATRRLRIVKYRGSVHGTNEYPTMIDEHGLSVLPISSLGLDYGASTERISSGIERLDAMLGGEGVFRGSSVLISGTAGMGKSTIAANFADAACRRGERVLYFAFEESEAQIMRNMRSVGLDLERWVRDCLLAFHAARPTMCGLELHLVNIHKVVRAFKPTMVVIDPLSNLTTIGEEQQVRSMLTRLIDFLKSEGVTAVFTDLTAAEFNLEKTDVGVSSLMDTWLLLKNLEHNGERNRGLYVIKSRGMAHSNQIREFVITDDGVELLDVYTGPGGVLTGASRIAQEARDRAEALLRRQAIETRRRSLDRKRRSLEAQIALLNAEFEESEDEAMQELQQEELLEEAEIHGTREQARRRKADSAGDT